MPAAANGGCRVRAAGSTVAEIGTLELIVRLLLAAVLGSILGYEREARSKAAGLRTHTLVALGAALFTISGAFGVANVGVDQTRVAAQVVTGIGFIGAGTIVRSGLTVTGLTTAATLWMAAALGVASAVGLYEVATVGGAVAMVTLVVLGSLRPTQLWRHRRRLELLYQPGHGTLGPLFSAVHEAGGEVKQMWMTEENGLRHVTASVTRVKEPDFSEILGMLASRDEVLEVVPPPNRLLPPTQD